MWITIFLVVMFLIGLGLFVMNFLAAFGSKLRYHVEVAKDWMGAGLLIMAVSAIVFLVGKLIGAL